MVVALFLSYMSDSSFFKQIVLYSGPSDSLLGIEVDMQILSKATRIVILHRLAVPKSLKNGIAGKQLGLNRMLMSWLML